MNRFKRVMSLYSTKLPYSLVYMAQTSEYRSGAYLRWFWSMPNFNNVQKRGQLEKTKVAKLLLAFVVLGVMLQLIAGMAVLLLNLNNFAVHVLPVALAIFLTYPITWANLLVLPMLLGRKFYIDPLEQKMLGEAQKIYSKHSGKIIAVAGSYGKTSMKELLRAVLGDSLAVASTPANKNVIRSLAEFSRILTGDEDVIVLEFGEAKPGDIDMFGQLTSPDIALITGVAPAHLDDYGSIDRLIDDFKSISNFVDPLNSFVSAQANELGGFAVNGENVYSEHGVNSWKVGKVKNQISGIEFTASSGKKHVKTKSGLLGRHQIGPLVAAIEIANKLGLSAKQIEHGIAKTKPYEHRMQPRENSGAWIIDDTYNGNIEGVKAGIKLLSELEANRRVYVTPGLVEQGQESERVHLEMGRLIAEAEIDTVVLMKNSATDHIKAGLDALGFEGKLIVEDNPLLFYQNIDQFTAAGDIVLMQNDWTDNYH